MHYSNWKSVSSSLPDSKRWRKTSNAGRVLWFHVLMRSDPYGLIETDDDLWADALFPGDSTWNARLVAKHRAELEEHGMLVPLVDRSGKEWSYIDKHDDHQPGEFKRKRTTKNRRSPELDDLQEFRQVSGTVPEPVRPVSVSVSGNERDMSTYAPTGATPTPRPILVKQIFEHWRIAFNKRSDTYLDKTREGRIRWAIDTYGVEQAKRCIDGYAKDPWDLRKANCDLTLLFRNAANFEKGLEFADGLVPVGSQTQGGVAQPDFSDDTRRLKAFMAQQEAAQ